MWKFLYFSEQRKVIVLNAKYADKQIYSVMIKSNVISKSIKH